MSERTRPIVVLWVAAVLAVPMTAVKTGHAQGRTVYDPSPKDPLIAAALAARARLEKTGGDIKAIEMLVAPDLVVNSPINLVVTRDNVLGRMRNGQIAYEEAQSVIEFVGVRGETVVIMGEEIVKPVGGAPNAGKTVRRRFTDIWREVDGTWKLTIRQATVTSVQ